MNKGRGAGITCCIEHRQWTDHGQQQPLGPLSVLPKLGDGKPLFEESHHVRHAKHNASVTRDNTLKALMLSLRLSNLHPLRTSHSFPLKLCIPVATLTISLTIYFSLSLIWLSNTNAPIGARLMALAASFGIRLYPVLVLPSAAPVPGLCEGCTVSTIHTCRAALTSARIGARSASNIALVTSLWEKRTRMMMTREWLQIS